jgi:uncharacterized protein YfaS (alpha-2-macroglobulin family)
MFLKKIILLFIFATAIINTSMAQKNKNYTEQWKKVEAFEKKGLTASALKEVVSIYNLAIKDKNDAQQIKSCMYQIKYRNMVQEESQEKNIFFVDTLIAKAKAPAKNILQSMQAEMMWQYLQNHRWQFYNRTELKEEKSKDISTWSLEKLHLEITKRYKASLDVNSESVLKSIKPDAFDAVIIKGENTRNLRPTLYDFLAFRALDYFMTDESDITKPAYQFTINDPIAFAPAPEFAQHRFETKDTSSLHYHALDLLRDILIWHIADVKDDALIDADLIRLNFVYQYAVNEDKEKLYETALKYIEERFRNYEASAQAMYLRAKIYYDKGQDFEPFTKTDNQYEIKRAKELCEAAIKKYPKSEGGINAQNLLNSILQPSLSLETEKVNVPLQPFRTLVKYKNVKTVYFRLIKTTRDEIKKIDRRDYEKIWKDYVAMKPLKSWSVALPDPLDYQDHSTEIKVDAVDNGVYFLLASIDENFALDKNIIAKQLTYVSNISYIHNNENDYYVLNRDNGQPLANSKIQVWESKYDYNKSAYTETKAEQYTTDKNGLFKLKKTKEYRTIQLQITNGSDELFMDENNNDYYGYNGYEEPKAITQTFLFTDRSIYRPGQTVYFKGIVITKANKAAESKVIPSFNSTLQLKDANGQKINELKMVTNEYGSYHGSFKLPEGSLNGQFSFYDSAGNGYSSFSVEEYKRPKFSVEVKKPSGTYRVNDSIKATGTAKAYAGNNVDGAAVKYRVVRKVRYPIWWDYGFVRRGGGRKIMPYGRNEEVEISNGTSTTDSKGEFNITFKALPDESINKKDQPTFYYEVSADITDLNGETRSGETSVAVAYQSLQLEIKLDDKMPADSLKNILVRSANLNDIEEKANVTLSIQQLKSPGKIFRERYWEQPDQFVMSKDEYYGLFPYDVYANENEVKNYSLGDKVFDKTDSSNKEWKVENGKLKVGWYKIVATAKDKYGEEVKAEKYIQLTGNEMNNTEPVTVNVAKAKAEPGEKIIYDIKSGFSKIWLIHTLSRMNDRSETKIIETSPLPSAQPVFDYEITEADRGGMAMSYAFVKHNRVYSGNESFEIPWSNKELNISYQTFRDKLLPGANEKWTVKISGNKGEKVSAEMLAGMYDASLDQFKEHRWSGINIWQRLYKSINWNLNGFESSESDNNDNTTDVEEDPIEKSYDKLGTQTRDGIVQPLWWLNPLDYAYRGRSSGGAVNFSFNTANAKMAAPPPTSQIKFTPPVIQKDEEVREENAVYAWASVDSVKTGDMFVYGERISEKKQPTAEIQIRKNFNETAFFFPDLSTDAEGNVSFSVTMPEALTQWKLMTLAHTKNLQSGYTEKTLVTQKPLMVQPNAPRFMREGDKMEFSAKIVNLLDTFFSGTVTLELFDAVTNKPVDSLFKNISSTKLFTTWPKTSVPVKFTIEIPQNFNSALLYRIKAIATVPNYQRGETFGDGEEMALPVLINRTLVTESMPLNLRNTTTKDFKFEKLSNSGNSKTISNHALTVEYTSNPAWYAVQALPYLMEYPYECAEQTFNRYYANTLASHITNSIPKIKNVFDSWAAKVLPSGEDLGGALLSNLQKNEELKSALLQETPWVMDAQNEAQQKKNIALLFDMVKMSSEATKSINQLKEMQSSNGGFVWFKGGPDDRYITQYIITGIGHLRKLNALSANESQQQKDIMAIVKKAIPYLDKKIKEDYDWLVKHKVKLKENNLSYTAIQYLYMRSFFTETPVAAASQTAFNYYKQQAQKYWLANGKYMQAMIALSLQRNGDNKTATAIIKSLKENSITNEEMGMYWKDWANSGWFWHQAPIESQALMIEAFTEIDKNTNTIDDLKIWLLKQKQTQNWGTTKATAEACYALLLNGSDWLKEEKEVTINLGNTIIKSSDDATEAGSVYFKKRIEGNEVKPEMGNISVSVINSTSQSASTSTSWGSVYWQYFEDLDKITSAETPLKLVKKLFVERNSDKGPILEAIADGSKLKVGDKIKVRIELRVDRDMEYVHMKDMRAACMEPVNVLSGYKYQGGLGYYESTKDASTNFFFSWLNKGTYVFEYPLFVTHEGNFSNGITTIQCMYAPEFTSHSEGVRVTVKAD